MDFSLREPYGELDLTRLLVEWLLVVFVTGGMVLMLRESTTESKPDTSLAAPKRARFLPALTMLLVILVLSLGGVSYTAVRRLKRLEVGIQNVRGLIGEQPQWIKTAPLIDEQQLPPSHPVGQLRPLTELVQQQQQAELKRKTEQLRAIEEELDKLH